MKKVFSMLLALCLALAIFVACSAAIGRGEPSAPASASDNEATIYIGVSQPLTGVNGEGGYQELLGILYANYVCPSVNISGTTYAIKLLTADNASDQSKAAEDARKFADAGIIAAIGGYGSAESLAAASVYDELGLPYINTSSTTPSVTSGAKSFRICYADGFQSSAVANFAFGKGLRKAAVLTTVGDTYSESLSGAFTVEFTRQGGEAFPFSVNTKETDYGYLASRIEYVDADFIYMPFENVDLTTSVLKQLRKSSVSIPVMGGSSYDFQSLISSASIYGKNVFFSSGFDENTSTNPITAEFVAKYRAWLNYDSARYEQNGNTDAVSPFSALGYDSYMVLVQAIKNAASIEPEDLVLAILQTDYEGVTGIIRFDENGDLAERLAYIKTINVSQKRFDVLQTSSVGR